MLRSCSGMVPIAGGTVELSDFVNTGKWMSANHTLADLENLGFRIALTDL